MADTTGAWRAEPELLDEGEEPEAESPLLRSATIAARTGQLLQLVGVAGFAVWLVLMYAAWHRLFENEEFGPSDADWQFQAEYLLAHVFELLLAALVIGLGSTCRLLAAWVRSTAESRGATPPGS